MDDINEVRPPKKIKTAKNRAGRKRNANNPLSPSRLYFNSDTQKAIVKFQNSLNQKEQETIYKTQILPAFEKLVENLINIHKFATFDDGFETIRNDAIVFLYETLRKFDANRGTNAFSYFNVVAKNWLIIKTKQKLTQVKRSISIDDSESMSAVDAKMLEERCTIECQDELPDRHRPSNIVVLLGMIREKVETENELACTNAIIEIFENIDNIDLLNKNAVSKYLQEISRLNPKQLTIALQAIKRHYNQMKGSMNDIDFGCFLGF